MTSFVDKVGLVDEALESAGVPHAFGGAIALAYAVMSPRATNDIDVNIAAPATEANRVLEALSAHVGWSPQDVHLAEHDGQVRVRWRDDRTPVDLFFPQHEFHGAVASGVQHVPFAGHRLPVIAPTHLAVFKVLFNRSKDWPDIEAMLRARSVDEQEALRWLDDLVGCDDPVRRRFADLVESTAGTAEADEMEHPTVDWRRLSR